MNAEGGNPRHGHRTPAELAEDEVLAALRDDGCEFPWNHRRTQAMMKRVMLPAKRGGDEQAVRAV
jgi:hypothetical protein